MFDSGFLVHFYTTTCMTLCAVFLSFHFPAACPVLCSGNGQYSKGTCLCYSGWKGPECDVPISQCIDPSCGGHGSCIEGNCVCSVGYKGENCEEGKIFIFCVVSFFSGFGGCLMRREKRKEQNKNLSIKLL